MEFKHFSTKRYGHEIGLSSAFRQPNADHSHCHLLHGYSLAFTFKFGCNELDDKNWVVDFGGLKKLKTWLEDKFDHKLVVDLDSDSEIEFLLELEARGIAELRFFHGVGAEKFAQHAFEYANTLVREITNDRCFCVSVECSEHGANSAIYAMV